MSDYSEIKYNIMRLAETFGKDYIQLINGEVVTVNEGERTCVIKQVSGDADNEIPDVKLLAESNDGFLKIPAVGSVVIIAVTRESIPFVLMFSDLKKVYSIQDQFQFNDGGFGGLVKVETLTDKLNNIENKVNSIINSFNAHTHPVSGSATTVPAALIVGTLTPTNKAEIENDKVIHG